MPVQTAAQPQRARGELRLTFRRDAAGVTRVETLYQQGGLKALLPRPVTPGICDAVLLNIAGGIAGGDELKAEVTLHEGAQVCLAGQAAERVYRALGGSTARLTTRLVVGAGARLDYLPQETIFFDGFALARVLEVELAATAVYFGTETMVFGRQAMGEAVHEGWLRDRISVRRNGGLLLQDMIRLGGDITAQLARPAVGKGAVAMATIIYTAPGAAALLPALQAVLQTHEAGVSCFDDMLVARLLACSTSALRGAVIAVATLCRQGRAMPLVWQG